VTVRTGSPRKTARAPQHVRVLQKTLDILEAIKREGSGLGLAEMARSVAMPKATVYRILATLEIRGYLDRDPSGGYRLSDKLFSLQQTDSPVPRLVRIAPPIMEELAEKCRETVNLGMLDGGEVVVIATVESPQSVRMASKVGNRRCFHTTAIGKAILAATPESTIQRLIGLKGLPQLTSNSITNPKGLAVELQRVRKQGFAVDNQENELEGRCIGMRIEGISEPLFALSISGPVFRMDVRRLRTFVPDLREACDQIASAFRGSM
jgi:IclR family acetate operon transcriptional repressor